MIVQQIRNSKNDEFYTPKYAITPLLKYLKPKSNIWCPFDKEESLYVKILRKQGHNVIATHIYNGGDFFKFSKEEINNWNLDYIISNPPYSIKGDILQRLFELKISFAMLVGVVGLFESQKRFDMFKNNTFEIMYLNKRVSYFKDYNDLKPALNPPFSSVYITSNILPNRIVFEEIDKKDLV